MKIFIDGLKYKWKFQTHTCKPFAQNHSSFSKTLLVTTELKMLFWLIQIFLAPLNELLTHAVKLSQMCPHLLLSFSIFSLGAVKSILIVELFSTDSNVHMSDFLCHTLIMRHSKNSVIFSFLNVVNIIGRKLKLEK